MAGKEHRTMAPQCGKQPEAKAGPTVEFLGGARRASIKPEYRLIPRTALRRLALTMTEGARKYGQENWRLSLNDPTFAADALNHAIEHLFAYANRDTDEDHLAHALANICFVIEHEWAD